MASQATKNLISVLGMAEGMAYLIEQEHPTNKQLRRLAASVIESCGSVHRVWGEPQITRAELEQIYRDMKAHEDATFDKQWETAFGSSMVLGLLNDLVEPWADGRRALVTADLKRRALDEVRKAMEELHRYFDRKLCKWDVYLKADDAVLVWEKSKGMVA